MWLISYNLGNYMGESALLSNISNLIYKHTFGLKTVMGLLLNLECKLIGAVQIFQRIVVK